MAKKGSGGGGGRVKKSAIAAAPAVTAGAPAPGRLSAVIDTRVVYCGDCLEQLRKLPDACVDLVYIDPPFNSNRNNAVGSSLPRRRR